ncbi:hypothetical protein LN042_36630 [Kitasatospora sp. RB6PN24]|uniref:hypothetical protein n=1 Tax=Kitasatospora humi TaxID=2893891 RepID=UPI001E51D3A9|nr:hypothetical protein [Kitasatospora humi]MCC9312516.1 hypothetical protein [Kitasatospora humi]
MENAEESVTDSQDNQVHAPGDGAPEGGVSALTAEQEAELDVLEARIVALMLLLRTQGRSSRHWGAAWTDLRKARLRWDHVLGFPE